jgi:hypothetical protein
MAPRPVHISSKAGIKRDGTIFEGDYYVDGQWVRFQRGLPRKMWGYKRITQDFSGPSRGMYTYPYNNGLYVTSGSANKLEQVVLDPSGVPSVLYDRTPAGFTASANNLWSIDAIYNSATTQTSILAHAGLNLNDISSSANADLYYGDVTGTAALTTTGAPQVSGGVLALHPFTVVYGNNGYVAWSDPNDPTAWTPTPSGAGEAFVTAQKIVAGINTRGGANNSPSALLWSLDSVIRMSYTGTQNNIFSFDTISDESSILSSQSVIEYDGIYFWCGTDRFLYYNGVVREVPNNMSLNWFFDNLNYAQRQKVFATKVPRFGEIWWCFPFGDATECTHAIIYNVREETWYDTVLPNAGRSGGQFARVYQYPLMMGTTSINAVSAFYDLTPGSGYVDGTYYNVPLINTTTATATGCTANIVVVGNVVDDVILINGGEGYAIDEVLTANVDDIGGTGSGFQIKVADLSGVSLWQHEFGVDEVAGSNINAIESYFETSDISLAAAEQSQNKSLRITMIEPDFVQSGQMTVTVTGRANARAKEILSEAMEFPAVATTPQEQVVFFKDIRREMRFLFRSNTVGGDYQMGMCLAHVESADGTVLGAVP